MIKIGQIPAEFYPIFREERGPKFPKLFHKTGRKRVHYFVKSVLARY